MDESRISTKRTSSLMKENESLKESLTKATQTINSLRIENKILLDELYAIRLAAKSEVLFRNSSHNAPVKQESDVSNQNVCLLSPEELQEIQNRILKRMLHQSIAPVTEPKPAAKKRRAPSSDASVSFRKNIKVSYDDDGNPILPLTFGMVTIHALGTVVNDRPAFHSKRYIWPVGFKSSRPYASITNPTGQSVYFSRIIDGGDAPKFEVWSEDLPERVFVGATPTGAWGCVIKLANELRGRKDASNSASGPDYFGLSNAIVVKLIEELPGANLCVNYEGTHPKETSKFPEEE